MYTEINTKYRLYISNWLLFMLFLVAAMIVVGGLTRLTDSGLSITEWEFFKGFFPPMNNDAWLAYFESYKQIPEFKLQNYSMTLSEFKIIFWWEWAHRFFGRVIGLAFLIPLIFFSVRLGVKKQLKSDDSELDDIDNKTIRGKIIKTKLNKISSLIKTIKSNG